MWKAMTQKNWKLTKGKTNNMKKTMALLLVATALTGCISGKKGPDETVVLENMPLTLPPNFELRPPRKAEPVALTRGRKEAKKLILGAETETKPEAKVETSDSWLIEKAGGDTRNKSIREIMAEEADVSVEEKAQEKGFFSSMFNEEENQDPTLEELAEMTRKEKEASQ